MTLLLKTLGFGIRRSKVRVLILPDIESQGKALFMHFHTAFKYKMSTRLNAVKDLVSMLE